MCGIDGALLGPCATPFETGPLAAGPHSFAVAAIERAGNQDPTPSTFDWSIAADTTITGGPAGATSSTSAVFTFASSAPTVSFLCSLDAAAPSPCLAPATYVGVREGEHVFTVAAVTAEGVVDPTPAVLTWLVDTSPSDTSITSGPSGAVESTSATFDFTSTEAGAAFECRLGNQA